MQVTHHLVGSIVPGDSYADAFFKSYGFAMVEWARVEDTLTMWFIEITGMSQLMARAILTSAKAFSPQALMLSNAAEHAAMPEDAKSFLKEAIDKAVSYYQFRNRIAHGTPRVNATDPANLVFEWHDAKYSISLDPLTRERIDICARNFGELANAVMSAYFITFREAQETGDRSKSLQSLQRQVFLLPNPADRAAPSQKQLGKLKQREQIPSRDDKRR